MQNASAEQLKLLQNRQGSFTKLVIIGDPKQKKTRSGKTSKKKKTYSLPCSTLWLNWLVLVVLRPSIPPCIQLGLLVLVMCWFVLSGMNPLQDLVERIDRKKPPSICVVCMQGADIMRDPVLQEVAHLWSDSDSDWRQKKRAKREKTKAIIHNRLFNWVYRDPSEAFVLGKNHSSFLCIYIKGC